ncbi:hypothetical protein ACLOJK_032593 [Asimina triloba]
MDGRKIRRGAPGNKSGRGWVHLLLASFALNVLLLSRALYRRRAFLGEKEELLPEFCSAGEEDRMGSLHVENRISSGRVLIEEGRVKKLSWDSVINLDQ